MSSFTQCDECSAEYRDPADRRFHAQPNACPRCGPKLELWDRLGNRIAEEEGALLAAVGRVREGKILALKGLGGFHLIVDARNEDAVRLLRRRKHREEKPFAVMFPNLNEIGKSCLMGDLERTLLTSVEAPIVLLAKRFPDDSGSSPIARRVAPHNPNIGAFLPYTPLHHLLLADLGTPVVATSGNLSDEPICHDEFEALNRLGRIADFFLVHDRPIVRQVDDSVVRVVAGREMILRRSRGYAPVPISLRTSGPGTLAVGAHFKNVIGAAIGNRVYLSQHVGDLETMASFEAFRKTADTFRQLKDFSPEWVAHDLHPDYLSTSYAKTSKLRLVGVQHHEAHILSCMGDAEVEPPLLGIAWDGTGLGIDGTIWGGEFLRLDRDGNFHREAHLRTFRLPGGDAAAREPSRTAFGLLASAKEIPKSLWKNLLFMRHLGDEKIGVLKRMLSNHINSPLTSSMGRLFDAVAAIVGQRFVSRFEGQAAMDLEFLIRGRSLDDSYTYLIEEDSSHEGLIVDWAPTIQEILEGVHDGVSPGEISIRFHNTLVEAAVEVAKRIGEKKVLLSGGCFQNGYLSERLIWRLRGEGFYPYWHRRVPPNDGGIALGQVLAAFRKEREESCV